MGLAGARQDPVFYQAHRGGPLEAAEGTLSAYRRSWDLGGIPEVDLRTTADGVVVCLHDATPARTTDAPAAWRDREVTELTWDQLREVRVHDPQGAEGEAIPTLDDVLGELRGHPERWIYFDLKTVDLPRLAPSIAEAGVEAQVIFCHNRPESLQTFRGLAPRVRTMQWIGGDAPRIRQGYAEAAATGFPHLDQVQLHLPSVSPVTTPVTYRLDEGFLRQALAETRAAGVDLQLFLFDLDEASVARLLDLGIRWYAVDEPGRFASAVAAWREARQG